MLLPDALYHLYAIRILRRTSYWHTLDKMFETDEKENLYLGADDIGTLTLGAIRCFADTRRP